MGKDEKNIKVVFVGGGTGGHITPSFAVADVLKGQGCQITFIGSKNGPDEQLVKSAGYEFQAIAAGKLRRYFSWQNFIDIISIVIGTFQSLFLLAKVKPKVVFAKGGYVSVPVVYGASWLGIPVVSHESDATLGLANRIIAAKTKTICTGFPTAIYPARLQHKLRYTGNPIRQIFKDSVKDKTSLAEKYGFSLRRPTVLFIGGSQGAHRINELVFLVLTEALRQFQIIHLTGPADFEQAQRIKQSLTERQAKHYLPFGFVKQEIAELFVLSDLVVSRASANTLAELSFLGKVVVLIPLPSSASDHQRANAKIYAESKAAVVWEEDSLTSKKLLLGLVDLYTDRDRREDLAKSIKHFSSPQAAQLISEIILDSI